MQPIEAVHLVADYCVYSLSASPSDTLQGQLRPSLSPLTLVPLHLPSTWPPALYVINAASLSKPHAMQQLTADLGGYGIDVAVISESHLISIHTNNMFNIPGYQLFRRDRLRRKGGGVALYARSEQNAVELTFKGDNVAFELLWIKVHCGTRNVIMGVLYHPPKPSYKTELLLDYIEAALDDIALKHTEAVVVLAGEW